MEKETNTTQERKNKGCRTYRKQRDSILVNALSFRIRRITRIYLWRTNNTIICHQQQNSLTPKDPKSEHLEWWTQTVYAKSKPHASLLSGSRSNISRRQKVSPLMNHSLFEEGTIVKLHCKRLKNIVPESDGIREINSATERVTNATFHFNNE